MASLDVSSYTYNTSPIPLCPLFRHFSVPALIDTLHIFSSNCLARKPISLRAVSLVTSLNLIGAYLSSQVFKKPLPGESFTKEYDLSSLNPRSFIQYPLYCIPIISLAAQAMQRIRLVKTAQLIDQSILQFNHMLSITPFSELIPNKFLTRYTILNVLLFYSIKLITGSIIHFIAFKIFHLISHIPLFHYSDEQAIKSNPELKESQRVALAQVYRRPLSIVHHNTSRRLPPLIHPWDILHQELDTKTGYTVALVKRSSGQWELIHRIEREVPKERSWLQTFDRHFIQRYSSTRSIMTASRATPHYGLWKGTFISSIDCDSEPHSIRFNDEDHTIEVVDQEGQLIASFQKMSDAFNQYKLTDEEAILPQHSGIEKEELAHIYRKPLQISIQGKNKIWPSLLDPWDILHQELDTKTGYTVALVKRSSGQWELIHRIEREVPKDRSWIQTFDRHFIQRYSSTRSIMTSSPATPHYCLWKGTFISSIDCDSEPRSIRFNEEKSAIEVVNQEGQPIASFQKMSDAFNQYKLTDEEAILPQHSGIEKEELAHIYRKPLHTHVEGKPMIFRPLLNPCDILEHACTIDFQGKKYRIGIIRRASGKWEVIQIIDSIQLPNTDEFRKHFLDFLSKKKYSIERSIYSQNQSKTSHCMWSGVLISPIELSCDDEIVSLRRLKKLKDKPYQPIEATTKTGEKRYIQFAYNEIFTLLPRTLISLLAKN